MHEFYNCSYGFAWTKRRGVLNWCATLQALSINRATLIENETATITRHFSCIFLQSIWLFRRKFYSFHHNKSQAPKSCNDVRRHLMLTLAFYSCHCWLVTYPAHPIIMFSQEGYMQAMSAIMFEERIESYYSLFSLVWNSLISNWTKRQSVLLKFDHYAMAPTLSVLIKILVPDCYVVIVTWNFVKIMKWSGHDTYLFPYT